MKELDWYDLPLYYDIIFDADTAREADFLEWAFAEYSTARLRGPWKVLEPACGSGRLMAELAERGARVSGFDLNPHMLEFARERMSAAGHDAELKETAMEHFHMKGKFDLAHCFVSTFKYILDEGGARSHLQHVASHLKMGGLYVLGMHLTDYARQKSEHERWEERRDGIRVVCNIHSKAPEKARRREHVRSRLRVTRNRRTEEFETSWYFRTYSVSQLRRLLRSVPELELIACYDFHYDKESPRKLDNSQDDLVMILRKR